MMVAASDDRGPAGAEDAEFMAGVFTEHGATEVFSTSDPDEGEAFVAARRFAIPAVEAKGSLLLEDVGVPLPALADLVSGVGKIAANHDLMISVIAHAGDGNTHPLIVYDPADAAMAERAQQAFGEIMDLAVGLGGTITGEHGVGRLKRPWLAGQLGPGGDGTQPADQGRHSTPTASSTRARQSRRCALSATNRQSAATY